jgi:enoyl-CoA hydratase/carnithine racemase
MNDIRIRRQGAAGRITLARPQALNALTPDMAAAIAAALDRWRDDPDVPLIVLDGEGPRAFCSGGDITEIYRALTAGDYAMPRGFWRDEYRLNLALARYDKPIAAFLRGFTMGGGVGLGCHVAHRIVGESSRIAMPECTIGLIPDVGGSHLLGRAPGRLGEFLGLTGARLGPGDAIYAGFADHYLPEAAWPALIARLEATGDAGEIRAAEAEPPPGRHAFSHDLIDEVFSAADLAGIAAGLSRWSGDTPAVATEALARNAPLALASALVAIRDGRAAPGLEPAFAREYRYVWRAAEQGDFREGIRARIIDKDNAPAWAHATPAEVTAEEVAAMLAPLGEPEWAP